MMCIERARPSQKQYKITPLKGQPKNSQVKERKEKKKKTADGYERGNRSGALTMMKTPKTEISELTVEKSEQRRSKVDQEAAENDERIDNEIIVTDVTRQEHDRVEG